MSSAISVAMLAARRTTVRCQPRWRNTGFMARTSSRGGRGGSGGAGGRSGTTGFVLTIVPSLLRPSAQLPDGAEDGVGPGVERVRALDAAAELGARGGARLGA